MKSLLRVSVFLSLNLTIFSAYANIQVFPTRINLSPHEKTATISIRLRSNKAETFRISTMFYKMSYDGSVEQRPDLARSAESAASFLRFSPKKVELKPNVEQIVRIRVKGLSKLKKEVRTHLYFRPMETPRYPMQKNASSKSSFELKAQIAVAIPVIITPRPIKKNFQLSNFELIKQGKKPAFKVDLTKLTPGFLYGDVNVYKVRRSKKELIGFARGISSYIGKRSVSYPLTASNQKPLTRGLYRLEFNEYSQGEPEQGTVKSIDLHL